jgi:translation initiation factor IF-2
VSRIRVYALAKELGVLPSDLKAQLEQLGVEVRTVSSTVDEATADTVRDLLGKPRGGAAPVAEVAGAPVAEGEPVVAAAPAPPVSEAAAPVAVRRRPRGLRGTGLPTRPPVVTVMGHVDHGKTTLLDTIRKTRVAASEVGAITQHIGAYQVEVNGRKITFIDTPGHAAFAAMRARGANLTDIVVLVVAADDGVMPQTREAVHHAQAAGVPIIVAVNKTDLPTANSERARQQLMEFGLAPEEWGGDTVFVNVSALVGTGVDELLDMILLVADMQELVADPEVPAAGIIIEARMDRQRGPLVTALVQEGVLRVGDAVIAGQASGKIRAMQDHTGKRIVEAGPSTPVEMFGLSTVPKAGDLLEQMVDEKSARVHAEVANEQARTRRMSAGPRVTLQDLYQRIADGEAKQLNLILKADVQGSVEALAQAVSAIHSPEVGVHLVHTGAGDISESDVLLATASEAVILGFNVRMEPQARQAAEDAHVQIRIYRVIYDVIDDVQAALVGMLEPIYREVISGRAEVRAIFKISRLGTIAGCYVTEGRMERNVGVRVIRNGEVMFTGTLTSLKHIKDDVREMAEGFECGISLTGFNNFEVGDIVEAFKQEEVRRETL